MYSYSFIFPLFGCEWLWTTSLFYFSFLISRYYLLLSLVSQRHFKHEKTIAKQIVYLSHLEPKQAKVSAALIPLVNILIRVATNNITNELILCICLYWSANSRSSLRVTSSNPIRVVSWKVWYAINCANRSISWVNRQPYRVWRTKVTAMWDERFFGFF